MRAICASFGKVHSSALGRSPARVLALSALLAASGSLLSAGRALAIPPGRADYFGGLPASTSGFFDVEPLAIAAGPEGSLWFTAINGVTIGRITPTGAITVVSSGFSLSGNYGIPLDITAGADGDLWFTRYGFHAAYGLAATTPVIGRVTPSGSVTEFELDAFSSVHSIAPGPHGSMWFTAQGAEPAVGRATEGGEIARFSAGLNAAAEPLDIAPGADGNLWFTDQGRTPAIGRVTPSGAIREFSAGLSAGSRPRAITPGPDGNLWFTDEGTINAIGRITPSGEITEFPTGTSGGTEGRPWDGDIAPGPDGNLWFITAGGHEIGRITPSGDVTYFGLSAFNRAEGVAPGPDGNLWLTAPGFPGAATAIARIGSGAPAASVSAPVVSGADVVGSPELCRSATWASWASEQPSASLYGFDGYRWFRDGTPVATGQAYTPRAADIGRRLSCTETVTYPLPFLVSASAVSAAVVLPGPPAPTITSLRQSAKRWREGNRLPRISRNAKPPVGTTFSFSLNERAAVTMSFTRVVSGRVVGGKCVAGDRRNQHRRACKHTVAAASVSFTGRLGASHFAFQGRISRHKRLNPGLYTLILSATNSVGVRSTPVSLSFRIVK